MKLSLCIPMYNESKILPDTLEKVSKYAAEIYGGDCEVVFADDGSTDGSADIVRNFGDPRIRVVGYEKNRGKGCAVRTAMLAAEGDIAIFTDCDLAYELDAVTRLAEMFDAHPEADIVVGSRSVAKDGYEGYPLLRKIASKMYVKTLSVIGGLKLSDSQTGLKGFRNASAKRIFSKCETNGFAFDFEVILFAQKAKMKILELPVKVINQGGSKVNVARDAVRMLKDVSKIKKRVKQTEI